MPGWAALRGSTLPQQTTGLVRCAFACAALCGGTPRQAQRWSSRVCPLGPSGLTPRLLAAPCPLCRRRRWSRMPCSRCRRALVLCATTWALTQSERRQELGRIAPGTATGPECSDGRGGAILQLLDLNLDLVVARLCTSGAAPCGRPLNWAHDADSGEARRGELEVCCTVAGTVAGLAHRVLGHTTAVAVAAIFARGKVRLWPALLPPSSPSLPHRPFCRLFPEFWVGETWLPAPGTFSPPSLQAPAQLREPLSGGDRAHLRRLCVALASRAMFAQVRAGLRRQSPCGWS
jgi:hypothetical protein